MRRALVLGLAISATTAWFGYAKPWHALSAVVFSVLVYWLIPRPAVPQGALHLERMPTVWMPDLLGVLLATTFLAMPFVISAREAWLGGPWMLMLFMWPPGLVALAIFWIAARYQCFWLLLEPEALTVSTMRETVTVPFASIARALPETTRPPRWLASALILFGGWRGLGVALLHARRQSHWLVLERKDAPDLWLPADAFPDARKVVKALERAGVPVADRPGREQRRSKMGNGKKNSDGFLRNANS